MLPGDKPLKVPDHDWSACHGGLEWAQNPGPYALG